MSFLFYVGLISYIPVCLNIFNIGVLLLTDGQDSDSLPLGKSCVNRRSCDQCGIMAAKRTA